MPRKCWRQPASCERCTARKVRRQSDSGRAARSGPARQGHGRAGRRAQLAAGAARICLRCRHAGLAGAPCPARIAAAFAHAQAWARWIRARPRVALWHAITHIEFSAIDLALDAAGRFGAELGAEFVSDFLAVAADEAMHFALLSRRLEAMGSFYGALPAHAGLWDAAYETRHDAAARLAVVPMVLEARGLDVTPPTIARLKEQGDEAGKRILERILDDEIRHVGLGSKHFFALCARRGEEPENHWKTLVIRHFRGSIKPPFNDSARLSAGLSRSLYAGIAL